MHTTPVSMHHQLQIQPRGPTGPFHSTAPAMHMPMRPQPMHMAQPPLPPTPPPSSPLPAGWSEHYTPQGMAYYYNAATGASTYERPSAPAIAAPLPPSDAAPTASATVEGKWVEYTDSASGQRYYYHTQTHATVWDMPPEYREQQQQAHKEPSDDAARGTAASPPPSATSATPVTAPVAKKQPTKPTPSTHNAAMYDALTREARVALFKAFLTEHAVAPTLKWQDALRLVAKEGWSDDPRWQFALRTSGEKKQSYAEYCTHANNVASIARRRRGKELREDLLALLAEHEALFVSIDVALDDVSTSPQFYALRQDARWRALEDVSEKRSLFAAFQQDLARKAAQQHATQRSALKTEFLAALTARADALELRTKRRLDSGLKTAVWTLLLEVGATVPAPVLKTIDRSDVFDWTDELLTQFQDEEHAARKRERARWREQEAQLTEALETKIRALVATGQVTAATQWSDVRDLVVESSASASDVATAADSGDASNAVASSLTSGAAKGAVAVDSEREDASKTDASAPEPLTLSECARVRVFEKIVAELRVALAPARAVVVAYLATTPMSSSLDIADTWTYDAFTRALTDGIRTRIDAQRPEDGEAADDDDDDQAMTEAAASSSDAASASSRAAIGNQEQAVRTELEALVKTYGESRDTDSGDATDALAFPVFVRAVYELLGALATEKKQSAAAHVTSSSSTGKDGAVGQSAHARDARSTSWSRKRRRDSSASPHRHSHKRSRSHSRARRSQSPAPRRSRSRSPLSPHHRHHHRREHLQQPLHSHNSPILDRSVVWNTSSISGSGRRGHEPRSAFVYDPLNGDDDMTLPPASKTKAAPLTAEEERARAEAIIREARRKLELQQQAQSASRKVFGAESELEDGEEPEEGEEVA